MTKTDCRRGRKDRRQTNERMEAVCRRGGSRCISIRMEYTRWRWRLSLSHLLSFFLEEANEKNGSCEKIRVGADALLCVRMTRPNA
jgi:hypothetical protein